MVKHPVIKISALILQSRNLSPNILLHLVYMLVHLRKLPVSTIEINYVVNRPAALKHHQKHSCGIFTSAERDDVLQVLPSTLSSSLHDIRHVFSRICPASSSSGLIQSCRSSQSVQNRQYSTAKTCPSTFPAIRVIL